MDLKLLKMCSILAPPIHLSVNTLLDHPAQADLASAVPRLYTSDLQKSDDFYSALFFFLWTYIHAATPMKDLTVFITIFSVTFLTILPINYFKPHMNDRKFSSLARSTYPSLLETLQIGYPPSRLLPITQSSCLCKLLEQMVYFRLASRHGWQEYMQSLLWYKFNYCIYTQMALHVLNHQGVIY